MKQIFAAGLLAMFLSACGGGNAQSAFLDACMKEMDGDREQCTCMATRMEEGLGAETFAEFGQALRANRGELEPAIESLPSGKQFQVLGMMAGVTFACMMGS